LLRLPEQQKLPWSLLARTQTTLSFSKKTVTNNRSFV
jgi:hypothetical protein